MAMGELYTARNPSATLLSRIARHKENPYAEKVSQIQQSEQGEQETYELVEIFLQESGADEAAAEELRNSPPSVQQAAMARGELATARNPSAIVHTRIGEELAKLGMQGLGDATKLVEVFLSDGGVDENAAEALRN